MRSGSGDVVGGARLTADRTTPRSPASAIPRNENQKKQGYDMRFENRMKFFLPVVPPTATQQEHKVAVNRKTGKVVFYDPPELKTARALFTDYAAQHRPARPITGTVQLVTKWIWPAGGRHRDGEYKATKPDTDNLVKLFKDCLTRAGYWRDDAQVASEVTEKFWGMIPGIYVEINTEAGHEEANTG